jgi:glutaredoxin-related protein
LAFYLIKDKLKSELVGGLDIVKELVSTGEFASVLPEKGQSLNDR